MKFVLAVIIFFYAPLLRAEPVDQAHTRVDLISEAGQPAADQVFWVGVRMVIDENWHVYWQNPGDSGQEPRLTWDLPDTVSPGQIQWPYPKRINAGPLTSYGYEHHVLLMVPLTFSRLHDFSKPLILKVRVDWLACKVDCIPGRADLELSLPAVPNKELFDETRLLLPQPTHDITLSVIDEGETWLLGFQGKIRGDAIEFFPWRNDVIDHAYYPNISQSRNGISLRIRKSNLLKAPLNDISGVAVNPSGWDIDGKVKALDISGKVMPLAARIEAAPMPFVLACIFAFLGGLILNLMPCVLPVLSLKVLSLLQHKDNRGSALAHGGMFALGVMVSFWVLAGVLIILKAAGGQMGWGFQFQSPVFVFAMAMIMFVFALNLLGVFELSFSGSIKRNASSSLFGSFGSGVLATVLATPCTAPFMGAALTFALAQPIIVGLAVFTCLGFGMALPYVLLSAFPKALAFIPKPGSWMTTLKSLFGFVLLACTIWLAWVYGMQKGADGMMILLGSLWICGVMVWLWGRGLQRWAWAVLILTAALAMVIGRPSADGIAWQKFEPDAVEAALKQSRPVFIDFTAAWCLTCQVNDRTVFQDKDVAQVFAQKKIAGFKADWTNYDADITRALQRYGRSSVPLYVYYAQGSTVPVILPELITREHIIKSVSN